MESYQKLPKIAQEQLNKMHRLEFPNSTPIQSKNKKNSKTNMEDEEQHGLKKNSKRK